jgi:hypothetical protein
MPLHGLAATGPFRENELFLWKVHVLSKRNEVKRYDTKQAIKFAFGMLRAERANAKEWKGNNSGIMMRETIVAPMAAEKGAAEKLKRDNRIHLRTTK